MIGYTGWTVDQILQMPARTFFVLRREFIITDGLKKADLCDIQWISNAGKEYYEGLRSYFNEVASPDIDKKKVNSRTFDVNNDEENKLVGDVLMKTFLQKRKLMGLGNVR